MPKFLITTLCLTLLGCDTQAAKKQPVEQSVAGTVVRKEWSKSEDAWNAGGAEYYTLTLDRPTTLFEPPGTYEELLLLPTDSVPQSRIAEFAGHRAQCRLIFDPGKPYIPPKGSLEQMPTTETDEITGEAIHPMQGSGFKVVAIK